MASLVAYDDSDSENETESARSVTAAGQENSASGVTRLSSMDFASGTVDVTKEGAQHTGSSPDKDPDEDPREQRLPLARLWRCDPGSCPSQKLQWPSQEPGTTFRTSHPPRPSLWMSQAPASHMPLAAACLQPITPVWDVLSSSLHVQSKVESTTGNASSSQRKRGEDCVAPYIPKRLRQLQAPHPEASGGKNVKPLGSPAAPLCVAPTVSEFIQPYLKSPYRETMVPTKVLFHLRGHRGPVNSIQWCPVFCKSHMLLSASMDKTFKVR